MNRWAIVRIADGRVVTFVRADLPPGFTPQAGCRLARESDLPVGWKMADDLPPVPAVVSDLALRRALLGFGRTLDGIDAAISSVTDARQRDLLRAWWDREIQIRRDQPELRTLTGLLGLTDAQVDGVFRVAGGAG
jgi:hypothetical protein